MSREENLFAIMTHPETHVKTLVIGSGQAVHTYAKTYYGGKKDELTLASTAVVETQWLADNNISYVRYL